MIRTEQIYFNATDKLKLFHELSKNLYNEGLYKIKRILNHNNYRQMWYYSNFMKTIEIDNHSKNWLRYNKLDKILKSSENYQALPAATSQQILKVLDRNIKSFFESIKEYTKHPEKFKGRPHLPKYKKDEFMLIFTNQQCKIKDGYLLFPKIVPLKIKTRLEDNSNLREVRIIPKNNKYVCEIIYNITDEFGEINKRWYSRRNNENRIIAIDLNVNPFAAIANNVDLEPFTIVNGVAKSINQYYNKEIAKLQSIYAKQKIRRGNKKDELTDKRNKKIKDVMHKASSFLANYAVENDIGNVVILHNIGWKQEVNLGHKVNQEFVGIPYNLFITMLQYKMEAKGIKVVINEESYTSKCSFLDKEEICEHETYLGKRMRGLFKSKDGILINSHIQGALNGMLKVFPNAFPNGIEGVGRHPRRLNIFSEENKPSSKVAFNSSFYKGDDKNSIRTEFDKKIDSGYVQSKSEFQ